MSDTTTDTAPAAMAEPARVELDDFLAGAPISVIDRAVLLRLHPGARTAAEWAEALDNFQNKGI